MFRHLLKVGAGAALAGGTVVAKNRENPSLYLSLPGSILQEPFVSEKYPKWKCKNREKLNEVCSNASWFDRKTVYPVNKYLDQHNIGLTDSQLAAFVADIKMGVKQTPSSLSGFSQQLSEKGDSQNRISLELRATNEHEGADMHKLMALAFHTGANVVEKVDKFIDYHASIDDDSGPSGPF